MLKKLKKCEFRKNPNYTVNKSTFNTLQLFELTSFEIKSQLVKSISHAQVEGARFFMAIFKYSHQFGLKMWMRVSMHFHFEWLITT